jgi:hypothetical protein
MRPKHVQADLDSQFYDVTQADHPHPEKGLLSAILGRAICDLTSDTATTKEDRRSANAWIFLRKRDERWAFTFAWVCLHLDLDPKEIRRWIRNEIEGGRVNRWSDIGRRKRGDALR